MIFGYEAKATDPIRLLLLPQPLVASPARSLAAAPQRRLCHVERSETSAVALPPPSRRPGPSTSYALFPNSSLFNTFPPSSITYSRSTSRSFNESTVPEGHRISTMSTFFASPSPK